MRLPKPATAGASAFARVLVSTVLVAAAGFLPARSAGAETTKTRWSTDFLRYAEQPGIQQDRPYGPAAKLDLRWADLLKTLPVPERWPELQAELRVALEKAEGVQRARLEAGGWLIAYLRGQKDELRASLPPVPDDPAKNQPTGFIAQELRNALDEDKLAGAPLADQVRHFEEQLLMFEPVDLAAVKKAIGGEENFARLQRLVEASKAMQVRAEQVFSALEKDEDEAAARKKMEELHKEFETAHGADQAALEPYQNDPLLGRYMASLYQQEMPQDYTPGLALPDLVKGVGVERATALLRRALRLPVTLAASRESGEATLRLARELIVAEAEHLKAASWALAHDVTATAVFEALQRRFGAGEEHDYAYQQARGYHLAALIQQGRVAAAVELATGSDAARLDLPYEVLNALERGGQAQALWDFLREWLSRHPAAGEWDRFNRLSAQLDRQAELKELIRTLAEKGAFEGMDRLRVQRMQAEAELATDDLAAAQKRLLALVATPAGNPAELRVQLELSERLMQLADLQGDAAAFSTAQTAAEGVVAASRKSRSEDALDLAATLATALNQHGRLADAERVCGEALRFAGELAQAAAGQPEAHRLSPHAMQRLVAEQLQALVGLSRWTEAESLMRESPWWGAGDMADLLGETVYSTRRPLGWYFAEVLRNRGQTEPARRILEAQLVVTPGSDAVYASYLDLAGPGARPLLAKLAATDRYQERPLIWQATLHLEAKELDQAAGLLESAIAIDPSDGEQGRGDRMRVYAVLGRVVAAKGDAAKAAFLDGVVKAIRLSETADRWFDAGAYARAIRLYRESLGFFQDAYCIQSRLAVRLANEGRMDEAAEHYRRAFELMPDSFGRVESHCFGCEHVFSGEKSQGVAEEVFARMLAARPEKPQLHYLLGYLRQEQKRPAEAAEFYRQAVRLDPLYLNAWNKLAGLELELKFTPKERDDLMLKLTELDPGRRHVSPELSRVTDLPRLWHALDVAQRGLAGLPDTRKLFALKTKAEDETEPPYWRNRVELGVEFGSVLASHRFVQVIQNYLVILGMPAGGPP